ncbi:MAG: type I-MYXAN CRISPR-associated protein Cas6/Cmx6 [Cyanobacteria bacterium]|nr:type I-MYXAN CRISPR-associated protein Cas6/Cmx6 [Cyanobacteriota bacterium]
MMNTQAINSPTSVENLSTQMIELNFPVFGKTLPVQHGYLLYSAICHQVSAAHKIDFQLGTIVGVPDGQGHIHLQEGTSLYIRVETQWIPQFLTLAGKTLALNGHEIRLGIPRPFLLKPASSLYSRLVAIKGFTEVEPFQEALQRQLSKLNIQAQVIIPVDKEEKPSRKVLKIKDKIIVGFSVLIEGLSAEDSIKLQTLGLGGRRKMGAGVMFPAKKNFQERSNAATSG